MALRPANFRLEDELLDGLRGVRERDGIAVTEQVRRAIRAWLDLKGVKVKSASRRGRARRKA